jgi:signal transduction histidine kinase
MTKRVIEEHGGRIEFSSVEGQGSEVTIRLPLEGSEAA